MKIEKEILKENNLINIDESMDVQFGKPGTPERERFREEARYLCERTCQNCGMQDFSKGTEITDFLVRSGEPRNTTSVTSSSFLIPMERGGYLKSPHLVARCIWLNINILQGSLTNYVRTEPIFVSSTELYRYKHLIISTLHTIQLLLRRLGLWVRAPSGSLEQW